MSGLSYLKIYSVSIDLISREINEMKNFEIDESSKKILLKKKIQKKKDIYDLIIYHLSITHKINICSKILT